MQIDFHVNKSVENTSGLHSYRVVLLKESEDGGDCVVIVLNVLTASCASEESYQCCKGKYTVSDYPIRAL